MVLRNGIAVKQYLYSDTDAKAQRIALHRVRLLQTQYPDLLQPSALVGSFNILPADVKTVTAQHLQQAVQNSAAKQWLVVAGWPCQDLSPAGRSRGMAGSRAQLLFDVVRILGTLQQLQQHYPPAYLLENVAFQYHPSSSIATTDFQKVCGIIGAPVFIDAAQLGSLAHRPRNFWMNLCTVQQLSAALSCADRPEGRTVQLAMQPQRTTLPVTHADRQPQYACNVPGEPRAAMPTLMGKAQSYAFRPGRPGSVLDFSNTAAPVWTEPTAVEREVMLGYSPGSTTAEGLTDGERCSALGQCMDANTIQAVMAISSAWWQRSSGAKPGMLTAAAALASAPQHQLATGRCCCAGHLRLNYTLQHAVYTAAAAQEALAAGTSGSSEIWLDQPALTALQQGQPPAGLRPPAHEVLVARAACRRGPCHQALRALQQGGGQLYSKK